MAVAHTKRRLNSVIFAVFLIMLLAYTALPILFASQTSFKTLNDIFVKIPLFWFQPTLEHWQGVVTGGDFLTFYKNSLLIATVTDLVVLTAGSMAGYALARFRVRKKEDLAFWILSQSMMPPVAVILPLYVLYSSAHLLDTYTGIVLAYTAFNLPFAVWLMRSFFEDVPIALEEAALVDGSTRLGVFFRISLPIVKPGLIACGVYTFVMCINEFFFAFMLTGPTVRPASVAIINFLPQGVRGTLYGEAAAAAILVMLPAVLLFFFLQRYFVAGMTFGTVKE